jgi:hypothetical protein
MQGQESKKPGKNRAKCLILLGWLMGLEPTTTGITITGSNQALMRLALNIVGNFLKF